MKIIALKLCLCAVLSAALVVLAGRNSDASAAAGGETAAVKAVFKSETRCGWFSNPTPSNAWLDDKDGE